MLPRIVLPSDPVGCLQEADTCWWEAHYVDGRKIREGDVPGTEALPGRHLLQRFCIVKAGEVLLEAFPPAGATGRNLAYRRRTLLRDATGRRKVIFLVGWIPMGPVAVLDLEQERVEWAETFTPGHPLFDLPEPIPAGIRIGPDGDRVSIPGEPWAHLLDQPSLTE